MVWLLDISNDNVWLLVWVTKSGFILDLQCRTCKSIWLDIWLSFGIDTSVCVLMHIMGVDVGCMMYVVWCMIMWLHHVAVWSYTVILGMYVMRDHIILGVIMLGIYAMSDHCLHN